MSLHRVNVIVPVYVYMEDDKDLVNLQNYAEDAAEQEADNGFKNCTCHATKVEELCHIDEDWRDRIPYGDDSNNQLTCQEILAGKKPNQKSINNLIYSALVGIQLSGEQIEGLGEEDNGVSLDINGECWDIVATKRIKE